MELFLNGAWFAITSAALLCWVCAPLRSKSTGPLIGLVALACVAALAFPAISYSDDCHRFQTAIEEPSAPTKLTQAQKARIVTPDFSLPVSSAPLLFFFMAGWSPAPTQEPIARIAVPVSVKVVRGPPNFAA